jgi:hypothetical protein
MSWPFSDDDNFTSSILRASRPPTKEGGGRLSFMGLLFGHSDV